ncbi:hypothetical protein GCK72_012051 [Caenorhabditis remanei]|uniref:F-box domain-containing protein n=1 Tax=Caenorhabditis remanei TaxID=31234 RepID=A0A6A5GLU9_CAERE|nr:hypothetical protein GCK72_012051 [Caenorhabditis remanei]KAF1755601.1 hypothetical protein GCK72_012051 [Caenorhabditis remanei]
MSSEFPLFRLPLIVLNHGLKLMTPFEILSLSLCSKRCNTVCQSLRNQLKCKEKAVKFQLKFSKKREIRMEFNYYPNTRWIFELEQFMAIKGNRETIIDKLYSIFQRKTSDRHELSETTYVVHIPNWIPTERSLEDIRDQNAVEEKNLKLYVPMEDGCFDFRTFINHLSYIFNITLTDLELHFQDFTREENETIIDLYCGNRRDTNCVKSLKLIGESENTPEDDEILYHILNRQVAKCQLTLDIKPTSKFFFYGDRFRYSTDRLIVRNSDWLSCTELECCNSFSVWMFNSKINEFNIEFMIKRWYSGWTPKWTLAMLELIFINIDDCIDRVRERIPAGLIAVRSEETIDGPDGLSHRIKYSIPRNDGTTGVFLVVNNKYLYIKMRDNTDVSLSTFITKIKPMM